MLDEFQRFKDILDEDSEAGKLASQLFRSYTSNPGLNLLDIDEVLAQIHVRSDEYPIKRSGCAMWVSLHNPL